MTLLAEPRQPATLRLKTPAPQATTETTTLRTTNDWLQQWCAMTSLEDRITAINVLSKRRLSSYLAAEVWLHLLAKATGQLTPGQMELLLRQFVMLSPDHPKASVMFDLLMNAQPASAQSPELIFMITSCERYMPQARRVLEDLQSRGAEAIIVIGDPTLSAAVQEGPIVRLPVSDTYEALTSKVLEGLTFVRRTHGPISIVKIDDDMRLRDDLDPVALTHTARTYDYVGDAIGNHNCDRCWHFGKASTQTPIFTRRQQGWFAHGAMYLLGPRAVDVLVREWVFYPGEFAGHTYEDRAVGDVLRRSGIELQPLGIAAMGGIVDHAERFVAPFSTNGTTPGNGHGTTT